VTEVETEVGTEATASVAKASKSIVPTKYAGKYKEGGSDELAKFINEQCTGKEGFEYTAFFELCKLNGIAAEKVDHYAGQVAEKRLGSQGRARMTLRNMLATFARKNGELINLKGEKVPVVIAKPALTGAAAKAVENAEAASEASADEDAEGENEE